MIDAHRVTLAAEDDFDGWRDAARDLAEAGVPPQAVVWRVDGSEGDLFAAEAPQPTGASFPVPRPYIDLAKSVVCHTDPERFALLYAMLWELRSNRHALEDRADPLVDRMGADPQFGCDFLAAVVAVHQQQAFNLAFGKPSDRRIAAWLFNAIRHHQVHQHSFRAWNMCWTETPRRFL